MALGRMLDTPGLYDLVLTTATALNRCVKHLFTGLCPSTMGKGVYGRLEDRGTVPVRTSTILF